MDKITYHLKEALAHRESELKRIDRVKGLLRELLAELDAFSQEVRQDDEVVDLSKLSPRLRETFDLIGEGLSQKQIAIRMKISTRTVQEHKERLKKLLKLDSTWDLSKVAIQQRSKR